MILVTGAQGTIGSGIRAGLEARGVAARYAARDPDAAGAGAVAFDFLDPRTHGPALAGVEALFLMRPPALADVERHLFPVIEQAQAAGVARVVFLSLLGAEHNPWVPHRRVERRLEASGLAWTFLRPAYFMQNLSTTHRADIAERDEIALPAGRGLTSFVDARDVAAVAVEALLAPGHAGRAYPLTGPEALSFREVAAILSEVLGREIRYRDPWLAAFVLGQLARGQEPAFALVLAGIYTATKLGLAGRVTRDVERLLGRPPIGFRRFAADHQEAWRRPEP